MSVAESPEKVRAAARGASDRLQPFPSEIFAVSSAAARDAVRAAAENR